ncbi:molecular chaperone [Penicillium sp. IBT 18751x]|nr:molecular chaperone [Penicillium sp. IBT 18751x]
MTTSEVVVNYYEILELSQDATEEQVRKHYKKLALKHHPDKNGGQDEHFKKVGEAYEILNDPARRWIFNSKLSKRFPQGYRNHRRTPPISQAIKGPELRDSKEMDISQERMICIVGSVGTTDLGRMVISVLEMALIETETINAKLPVTGTSGPVLRRLRTRARRNQSQGSNHRRTPPISQAIKGPELRDSKEMDISQERMICIVGSVGTTDLGRMVISVLEMALIETETINAKLPVTGTSGPVLRRLRTRARRNQSQGSNHRRTPPISQAIKGPELREPETMGISEERIFRILGSVRTTDLRRMVTSVLKMALIETETINAKLPVTGGFTNTAEQGQTSNQNNPKSESHQHGRFNPRGVGGDERQAPSNGYNCAGSTSNADAGASSCTGGFTNNAEQGQTSNQNNPKPESHQHGRYDPRGDGGDERQAPSKWYNCAGSTSTTFAEDTGRTSGRAERTQKEQHPGSHVPSSNPHQSQEVERNINEDHERSRTIDPRGQDLHRTSAAFFKCMMEHTHDAYDANSKNTMAPLPNEIWLLVAEKLDRHDLIVLSSTSVHLYLLLRPRRLGYIFLHIVAREQENAALKFLERHPRIDFGIHDQQQRTVLECVVMRGYDSVFRLLLAHAQGKHLLKSCAALGDTLLILAARYNQERLASTLIDAGADINARNSSDQTALYWAVQNGNYCMVNTLLKAAANVTFTYDSGLTASWLAARGLQLAILNLLISHGADVNARNAKQETLLCWAVKRSNTTLVKLLLDGGADACQTDKLGRDPLLWAALTGNIDIARRLLDRGARLNRKDRSGRTPLAWAVVMGHVDTAQMLLDQGADPEQIDKFGWTPMAWAVAQEDVDVTSLLVKRGAHVEPVGQKAQLPLMWAVAKRNMELAQLLLDRGADPMRQDKFGWSPLMDAVQHQDVGMIQLLISQSSQIVDARQTNWYGDSALSLALDMPSSKIVDLLQNM